MCGNEIQRLKIVVEGKIVEWVTKFNYLGNKISEYKKTWNTNYKHIIESMENKMKIW
jgi:hypothetical protein